MIRSRHLTIPNALTIARGLILTPALAGAIYSQAYVPALGILATAAATDWLDGYLARTIPGQASSLGSILDPAADKLLMTTLVASLASGGLMPLPVATLVISRDVALVMSSLRIRYKSLAKGANGKPVITKDFFNPSISSIQITPPLVSKLAYCWACLASPVFEYTGHWSLDLAAVGVAITTVWSGLYYLLGTGTFKLLNARRKKKRRTL